MNINSIRICVFLMVYAIQITAIGQNTNLKINYSVELAFDEGFSNNEILKDSYETAQQNSKHLKFNLFIYNDESFFTKDNSLNIENTDVNLILSFCNYKGETVQQKDYNFSQIEIDDKKFLIKELRNVKWELSNITKVIDGYLCFKATTTHDVVNNLGVFKHPVVAWYCPDLPYSFGPNGYGGLPGLIFQLQERNVIFGLKNITFNNKDKKTPKFDFSKAITIDEFNKILDY